MRKFSYAEKWRTYMDILTEKLRYWKFFSAIKKQKFSLKEKNICDVWCWYNCSFLTYLSNKESTLWLYWVDLTVNSNIYKKLHFASANLEKDIIGFEDEKFDIITSFAVIEHLNNPHHYLQEIKRILKKWWLLFLTTPSLYAKPVLETFAKLWISTKEEIYDHKIYYTKKTLDNLIKKYFSHHKVSYFQFGMNIFLIAKK